MTWMEGPLKDTDIFWLGLEVFWWKRAITVGQMLLGFVILVDLIRASDKQRFLDLAAGMKARSEKILLPQALSNKPILKWLAIIVPLLAVLIVSVLWWFSSAPFDGSKFVGAVLILVFVLAVVSIPIVMLIHFAVAIWGIIRVTQKLGPIVFHWLLQQLGFDLSIRLFVLAMLIALSVIQLMVS